MAWRPRVATQVPAQLVGLAAAWERRWSLGRRGPGCGPVSVFGKGLAGAPARVLPRHHGRPRQGSCRGSRGSPRQGSRRGSSSSGPHLILCVYDLDEDLHATTEVPPEPWFQRGLLVVLEPVGSRVAHSAGFGQVAPARLLPGPPRQGSCQGSPPRPLALRVSWSWRCFGCLVLRLPSSALLSVAVGATPTACAQVKG